MSAPQLLLLQDQTPPRETRRTQRERILELLRKHEWVTLPQILSLYIASHTKRLSELRKMGYVIELRREDGRRFSYKLVSEPQK